MGTLKLRTTHCLHCGTELKSEGHKRARIDRTYCSESCRVMAYRVRRQNRTQPDPEGTPTQKNARQPLLHKTLSALADLQAQIVNIGHTLREEEIAEQQHRPTLPSVDHEADKESLRRQLSEVAEKLQAAQNRIAELEGIASTQTERIRQIEEEKTQTKTSPATALQLALRTLAQEITRDEESWLIELGEAIRSGYDPRSDRLLDRKFEELRAEQNLADAAERAGGVPSICLHRRGTLLWPVAMFAAMKARQEEAERQPAGVLSRRPQIRLGQLLRWSDERDLCELSAARTRDLMRKVPANSRR